MNFSYWECIHHQKTVQPFQNRLFFKVWSQSGQLSYKSCFQKRHPLTIGFKKQFKKNENVFVTRLFLVASSLLQTCVVSIRHIMMDSKDCYFSVLRFFNNCCNWESIKWVCIVLGYLEDVHWGVGHCYVCFCPTNVRFRTISPAKNPRTKAYVTQAMWNR